MHKLSLCAVVLAVSQIASAHAPKPLTGYYILGNIGQSIPAQKFGQSEKGEHGNHWNVYDAYAKSSFAAGIGVGYSFRDKCRAEIVVNHRFRYWYDHSNVNQKISATSVILSAHHDFLTSDYGLAAYLTAGIGASVIKAGNFLAEYVVGNTIQVDDVVSLKAARKTNFAWQVGLGLRFRATERTVLDVGYKFTGLGKFTSSANRISSPNGIAAPTPVTGRLKAHELSLGLIYFI